MTTTIAAKPLPTYKKAPKSDVVFLKRVRRLLELGWIKEFFAAYKTDSYTCAVDETDPNACLVCLAGAGNRVECSNGEGGGAGAGRLATLLGFKPSTRKGYGGARLHLDGVDTMINWNDRKVRTQAQVLQRIDTAIASIQGGA